MLRELTMSERTDKLYSELGEMLDATARERNVRGPYAVAKRVTSENEYQVSGQAVSRVFYGENYPRSSFIAAFAKAFELSREERDSLARLYTYGELQDNSESSRVVGCLPF
jgi:hypothetical protein